MCVSFNHCATATSQKGRPNNNVNKTTDVAVHSAYKDVPVYYSCPTFSTEL